MVRQLATSLALAAASGVAAQHHDTRVRQTPLPAMTPVAIHGAPQAPGLPEMQHLPPVAHPQGPSTVTSPPVVPAQPTPVRADTIFEQNRQTVLRQHHNTNGHRDTSNRHRDTSDDDRNAGDYFFDGTCWVRRSDGVRFYGSQKGYYRDHAPFVTFDSSSYTSSGVTYLGASAVPVVTYGDGAAFTEGYSTEVELADPVAWCEPISVTIDSDKETYLQGEDVRLTVNVNRNAYIYVYSTDRNGVTQQLLPNYYERSNFLRPSQTMMLPSASYGLKAVGSGWDDIRVVAVNTQGSWNSPPVTLSYNANKPFVAFRDGYDSARGELCGELAENLRRQHGRAPGGNGVIVVPGRRPLWGESSTRVFIVDPGVGDASAVPPPIPDAEQPGI
ncbi:DUF4384 domain-containing protein [Candidatus Sumerlaeota bacterium]|nr:DUF4384 domain-containing protein [Candidatus Sumerlaeota bacterium]